MISTLAFTILALPGLRAPKNDVKVGFAHTQEEARPVSVLATAPFMVSFYNAAAKPVTLLSDHCSWGYESLSFEITNPAGKHYSVRRTPRGWDKNYPMPVVIQPGDVLVRSVNFADGSWRGMPPGIAGSAKGWKIQAILAVRPERIILEGRFWTGTATSAWANAAP